MTEEEWLACAEPWPMLDWLVPKQSERKLRLLACLCCRRIWNVIPTRESRRCIEVAEQYAEGCATREELDAAIADSMRACEQLPGPFDPVAREAINAVSRVHRTAGGGRNSSHGVAACTWATAEALRTRTPDESVDEFTERRLTLQKAEYARQCELFREFFGNPLRPVTFSPDWRTDTAVELARQMYKARDFSAMPILADALQDAGCDSDEVLDHCRGPGPHVRGCWVVDELLGKT